MKNKGILIVIFLLTVSAAGPYAQVDRIITVVADIWNPYNGVPTAERPGFVVELAREIFKRQGYSVEYLQLPWTRALISVEQGLYDAVLCAFPEEIPTGIFPEEETGIVHNCFFVRSESDWEFQGIQSLENHILGGVQDYNYRHIMPYVEEYKDSGLVSLLTGDNAAERNLMKLINHRIDIYVEDRNVGLYTIASLGLQDQIKIAGVEGPGVKAYVVFSPAKATSGLYAVLFSEGIRKLRRDGTLKTILDRYGLEDWK